MKQNHPQGKNKFAQVKNKKYIRAMKNKQTLPPEEWQVGDIVRIVADESGHGYPIASEVEIHEVEDGYFAGHEIGNYKFYFTGYEAEWLRRPNKEPDLQAKVDGWYKDNIYPLAQRLCKTDEGNSEANFGQMLELLNDLADEINREPVTTIRKLVELAELRRNK